MDQKLENKHPETPHIKFGLYETKVILGGRGVHEYRKSFFEPKTDISAL